MYVINHYMYVTVTRPGFLNEGKSAACFCCQVAACVTDMFCNFYLVKNHKIANNSTTTKAREIITTDLISL